MHRRLPLVGLDNSSGDLVAACASSLGSQADDKPQTSPDGKFVLGKDFRIFPYGRIDSEKGTFRLTHANAEKIAAAWSKRGNYAQIDYEHGLIKTPPGQPVRTAGKFKFEARPDGLFATDVHWTKEAFAKIQAGEYEYHSPLFGHSPAGEITAVENLALTVDPAMHGQPRVAASAIPYADAPVVDGAWDADAAEHRIRKWASSDGSGDTDKIDWRKYGEAFAYCADGGDKLGDYKLPHHDIRDGKLVTVKRGVEAAAAAVQGARGGADIPESDLPAVRHHLAEHYHQWGGKAPWEDQSNSKTKTSALSAVTKEPTVKTKLAKYLSDRMEEHELEPKELAKHCGMEHDRLAKLSKGEEAPTEEELTKLAKGFGCKMSKLAALAKEKEPEATAASAPPPSPKKDEGKGADDRASGFAKLTALANGVEDPSIKGAILGLADLNQKLLEQNSTLSQELTGMRTEFDALSKSRLEADVTAEIDRAIDDGKVSPAQREPLLKIGLANRDTLKSFLAVAQPIGPGRKAVQQPGRMSSHADGGTVDPEDINAVAEAMGRDPKELLENYKAFRAHDHELDQLGVPGDPKRDGAQRRWLSAEVEKFTAASNR